MTSLNIHSHSFDTTVVVKTTEWVRDHKNILLQIVQDNHNLKLIDDTMLCYDIVNIRKMPLVCAHHYDKLMNVDCRVNCHVADFSEGSMICDIAVNKDIPMFDSIGVIIISYITGVVNLGISGVSKPLQNNIWYRPWNNILKELGDINADHNIFGVIRNSCRVNLNTLSIIIEPLNFSPYLFRIIDTAIEMPSLTEILMESEQYKEAEQAILSNEITIKLNNIINNEYKSIRDRYPVRDLAKINDFHKDNPQSHGYHNYARMMLLSK